MNSLLEITTSTTTTGRGYQLERVDSTNGLFLEQFANMQLYSAEWKFVTRINLSLFEDEYKHMESIFDGIKKACTSVQNFDESDSKINCIHIVNQMEIMLEDSKDYSSKWFIGDNESHNRKKRGLFDAFGYPLKWITGTLTASDGRMYSDMFKNLEDNQMQQEIIIKKQTSIISNSLEYIEKDMQLLEKQTNNIEADVKDIYNMLVSINQTFIIGMNRQKTLMTIHNKLHSLIDYFSLLIMQFGRKQTMFLEAIAISQKNPSSPILIPPEILRNELLKVASFAGSMSLGLPFSIIPENLPNFYQILKPESSIVENSLIIRFSIPLVNPMKFKLYKASSLPYKLKGVNLFAYIVPKFEYFAMDNNRYEYVDISNEELKNCYQAESAFYICKQNFPMFSTFHNKACEVNVLIGTNSTEQCDIRISNMTNELWIKIHKPNTYIYALPKSQFVHITCAVDTETITLYDAGIITIFPTCKIKTDGMEITGFQTYSSDISKIFTPSVPLHLNISVEINKLLQLPEFNIPQISKSEIISNGENKKLSKLSVGIRELKEMEEHFVHKKSSNALKDNLFYISIFLIIFIVLVVIIIAKICVVKCLKCNLIRSKPVRPARVHFRKEDIEVVEKQRNLESPDNDYMEVK